MESDEERENNDKQRILDMIDTAYKALTQQKISGTPKQVKESVLDQLLLIHENIAKKWTTEKSPSRKEEAHGNPVTQQQIDKIEKDIAEIKATLMKPKTWAQTAATSTVATTTSVAPENLAAQLRKQQERETLGKAKRMREITLSVNNASNEVKQEL